MPQLMWCSLLKLLKLVKLAKTVTMPHVSNVRKKVEKRFSPASLRLINTLLSALAMIHTTACAYHWISRLSTLKESNTWVIAHNLIDKPMAKKVLRKFVLDHCHFHNNWVSFLTVHGLSVAQFFFKLFPPHVPVLQLWRFSSAYWNGEIACYVYNVFGLTSFSYIITAMSRAMDMFNADELRQIGMQQVLVRV
jgi:hypothetical protein